MLLIYIHLYNIYIKSLKWLSSIFKKNIAIYAESGALSAEDATKLVEQAVTVDVSAEEK